MFYILHAISVRLTPQLVQDEPIEPVEFDLVEYPDDAPKPEREREHRREEPYERREDRRRHSRPKPREPGPKQTEQSTFLHRESLCKYEVMGESDD